MLKKFFVLASAANAQAGTGGIVLEREKQWPCHGINPYKCGVCPTPEIANHMLQDLDSSCNIPSWMGLNTAEDVADGTVVTDSLIYHTKWTQTSIVHPDLLEHMCISPVCRWRVEMAFDAFALCSALDKNTVTSWRSYTELSMLTVKHLITVMKSSKDSCKTTLSPKNLHRGTMVHQKLQVSGVDGRSDTTLREAELAFRQALSSMLDIPMRKMDVRIESEPARDCDHSFDNPICRDANCGYGQCIATEDGKDYTCLCNECYKLGMQNGYKTCVKDEICFFSNPCEETPNPCSCGSECIPCPECQGQKFQCKCQLNFSGADCSDLSCPAGFREEAPRGEHQCGVCAPVDATNVCDPNPCQHGGVCTTEPAAVAGAPETYKCACPEQYSGGNCETLVCPEGYFEQSGKCINVATGTQDTEVVVEHCDPNPCMNGGHCLDDGDAYSCLCPPMYEGTDCESRVNPCYPDPCDGVPCRVDETTALGYFCECPTCKEHTHSGVSEVFGGFFSIGGRRLSHAVFREFVSRRTRKLRKKRNMQVAKDMPAIMYEWQNGEAVPGSQPVRPDIDTTQFGTVDNITPHCHVYQNAKNQLSEITLSVKCPRTEEEDATDCEEVVGKLNQLQQSREMQREVEKRSRYNCIASQVEYVSTPGEEVQISNCPSLREFNYRWHYVWKECGFEALGFGENDEWKVYIGGEGVETLDISYLDLFCQNPVCRGMAMDLTSLFSQCSNSAPGLMGQLSRKTKAMRNSLKVCGNPPGAVVQRQQMAVVGVLDPLSRTELLAAEVFMQQTIVNATSMAPDRVVVLTQPVLHVNDFWSRTPFTANVISARSNVAMGAYTPTELGGLKFGETPIAYSCLGLCINTASPGPTEDAKADPASSLFVTFSEPVKPGACLQDGSCKVTLSPQNSRYGFYHMDQTDTSSSTAIVASGTTAQMKPRLFLKPNTNYTVTLDEGVFEGLRTGQVLQETKYWFLTGPPASSVVKISIMLGCDDQNACDYYHEYMPDFAGDTEGILVKPLENFLHEQRNLTATLEQAPQLYSKDMNIAMQLLLQQSRRGNARSNRRLSKESALSVSDTMEDGIGRILQESAAHETSSAEVGDPLNEGRKAAKCITCSMWFVFCLISCGPIAVSLLCAAAVGRAVYPWVQDTAKEGYQKVTTYAPHCDGGYKSKLVENPRSVSARLFGPHIYTPVFMLLSVVCSAALSTFFMVGENDTALYWLAAMISGTVSSMIWNLYNFAVSVWVDPAALPFRSSKHKTMLGAPGAWNLGSEFRQSPLSTYPLMYSFSEKEDYDQHAHDASVSDTLDTVNISVPRQVNSGTAAMSRYICGIPYASQAAHVAFYATQYNFVASVVSFTGLAMQLCPQPVSIDLVYWCSVFGVSISFLFLALNTLLMKTHTFVPVAAVVYSPSNQTYFGQAYLAQDVEFEEGTNKVAKFNHLLPGVARAEGVQVGYELISIIEKHTNGKVATRSFASTDNVKSELLYMELQGAEITCIFKAPYYPHLKDVNRSFRSNKYLPPILPSSKKANRGGYGGISPGPVVRTQMG